MTRTNTITAMIYLSVCMLGGGCATAQGYPAHAESPAQTAHTLTIHRDQVLREIPRSFMGINLSYFNDADDIWAEHDIEDKVRRAGVAALRYPGGEETSFFHWQHPGVNGYEDIHDDPAVHGNPRDRGPFQVTWVAPDKWQDNTRFMSFDDYMARCKALNAEPIVGLNLSCGRAHDRREAGLEEALQWMRYCKEKGYEVRYWFLDNEPWHFEAAYTFSIDEYAEDVLYFGKAIKKEFPEVKLIVNPASSETINHKQGIKRFIEKTGEVIDYIDIHWYWSWGSSSWDKWLTQTPMRSGDQWKDDWMDRPYGEDVRMIRDLCKEAGYPGLGVTVLEWNVGPSEGTWDLPGPAYALIQAQMLMEFLDADVQMTCLWTLLWQSRREVWPRQDRFQSIVTHEPPHSPTASLEVMRLFSSVLGKNQARTETSAEHLVSIAAVDQANGTTGVLLLNKSDQPMLLTINSDWPVRSDSVRIESVNHTTDQATSSSPIATTDNGLTLRLAPYSFTAVNYRSDE